MTRPAAKAPTNNEYSHKGVAITFIAAHANFTASIGPKVLNSSSLEGIKNKIDKAKRENFQPFTALFEISGYQGDNVKGAHKNCVAKINHPSHGRVVLVRGTVTGVVKGHRAFDQWSVVVEHAPRFLETRFYYPDTPEAIAAWTAYYEAKAAENMRHETAKLEVGKLHDAIPIKRCGAE